MHVIHKTGSSKSYFSNNADKYAEKLFSLLIAMPYMTSDMYKNRHHHKLCHKLPVKSHRSHATSWEPSGSVVECLTRDRGAAGSSLTGIIALWYLSKAHLSLLSTGSTQEDPSLFK